MGVWSERWLRRPVSAADADPRFLMWTIRGLVVREQMPAQRTVAHFRLREAPDEMRYWWLVLDAPDVDLCLHDPGFETNLTVNATPRTLAEVVSGDRGLAAALRNGEIELIGSSEATRGFRRWFGLSPFAEIQRPGARAGSAAR